MENTDGLPGPYIRPDWYKKLLEQTEENVIDDRETFFVPYLKWHLPPTLIAVEKYQAAALCYSLLLISGVNPEMFESLAARPGQEENTNPTYRFDEGEDENNISITLIKFYEHAPELNEETKREQAVRLVLLFLDMFEISVEFFMLVLSAGWMDYKGEKINI